MIVLGNENECDINNMFSDNVYKEAKYFNNIDNAVDYVHKSLTYYLKDNFVVDYGMEFLMNYSLDQIKRISEDAENLDYEDYHDLAFIKNNNSEYFADLIIIEGKFGLRYSKYINDEEYDNLCFEECELDLSSPSTLMLGMKEKLDNFAEKELQYEVTIGI